MSAPVRKGPIQEAIYDFVRANPGSTYAQFREAHPDTDRDDVLRAYRRMEGRSIRATGFTRTGHDTRLRTYEAIR